MKGTWDDMNAAELIQWIADKEIKSITIPCTVQSVNKEACTIVAIPFDNGYEFDDVPLRAANDGSNIGIITFPVVGSQVLISRILKFSEFYVSAVTEIDEMLITIQDAEGNTVFSQHITPDGKLAFNGGNNGGLIMIAALVQKLNALESRMNSHQHLYIPYPGGIAGVPVGTTTDPISNPAITETQRADIEDNAIKH